MRKSDRMAPVKLGTWYIIDMPRTGEAMRLNIAGKPMEAILVPSALYGAIVHLRLLGASTEFCAPVLPGEAGFFTVQQSGRTYWFYKR